MRVSQSAKERIKELPILSLRLLVIFFYPKSMLLYTSATILTAGKLQGQKNFLACLITTIILQAM